MLLMQQSLPADLLEAVSLEFRPLVRKLILSGADVNIRYVTGSTPIIHATEEGCSDVVNILIEAGADVNMCDKIGITALMIAASQGDLDCLQTLIAAGADVNKEDDQGTTALMEACIRGRMQTIHTLIEAGASVNSTNNYSWTPLMITAHRGHAECTRILIENGADVNTRRPDGSTAFTSAVISLKTNCAKLLLLQGALINTMGDQTKFLKALTGGGSIPVSRRMYRLIRAAGQGVTGMRVRDEESEETVEQSLKVPDDSGETAPSARRTNRTVSLQSISKEAIRTHLLRLDPNNHLFGRIPKLGLPLSLVKYLLYQVSLDSEESSDDDEDEDDNYNNHEQDDLNFDWTDFLRN